MDVLGGDYGRRCCLVGHKDVLARFATSGWCLGCLVGTGIALRLAFCRWFQKGPQLIEIQL